MRALDARAMELASQRRGAAGRAVPVRRRVPACRSLDDLARHLTGFLGGGPGRLHRRSPRRCGSAHTKAGRTALGAAAAGGVRHMAHRFIVGETPTRGAGRAPRAVGARRRQLCRPARRGHRHRGRGRPLRSALPRGARGARRPPPGAGRRARCSSTTASGRCPRANVSVKVSALTPLLRPDAPVDRAPTMRPHACGRCCGRARELGAHIHIDMESLDSREAVLELVLELLVEEEFATGRPPGIVLQAYLRDSPGAARRGCSSGRAPVERTPPLQVRLVKGAYWDHELVQARQHGWPAPGVRGQGRVRPQLRSADAPAARRAPAASASPSPRTTSARSRTRSPSTGWPAATIATSSSRSCAGSATSSRTALATRGHRVRTYCPVGDLVAGNGVPRPAAAREHEQRVVPATSRRAACRSSSCWRPPDARRVATLQ